MDQNKMMEGTQASRVDPQYTDTTLQTQMILVSPAGKNECN